MTTVTKVHKETIEVYAGHDARIVLLDHLIDSGLYECAGDAESIYYSKDHSTKVTFRLGNVLVEYCYEVEAP